MDAQAQSPLPQQFSHWPAWPVPFGLAIEPSESFRCPYLPGRLMSSRAFMCDDVPAEAYQQLLDAGFRRSGRLFYQPACRGCRSCVPLRVAVKDFAPSRSQRRCRRRNADLKIEIGSPEPTAEKHAVYARYLAARHDRQQGDDWFSFVDFLYASPTQTIEFVYRDAAGKLIGAGLCDLTPQALSTVYFYFEPDESRRGIGIYSSLCEIDHARASGRRFYYLGFWVSGCRAMAYKNTFRPAQMLCTDGVWRPLDNARDPGAPGLDTDAAGNAGRSAVSCADADAHV